MLSMYSVSLLCCTHHIITLGDCRSPLLELLDLLWLSAQLISRLRPRGVVCLRLLLAALLVRLLLCVLCALLDVEISGLEVAFLGVDAGGTITVSDSLLVLLDGISCWDCVGGDGVLILAAGDDSRDDWWADLMENVLLHSCMWLVNRFSHWSLCCRSCAILSS